MRRPRRILLIAGVLLMFVSIADARPWGRKADKPAETASVSTPTALTAVDVEGSRVLLRTSGAPAYTSYSPSPGVFVIDLAGTTRERALTIPAVLPAALASVTAEEVVEMGSGLTRVTFRLTGSGMPDVAAVERGVVVTIPAGRVAEEPPAVDVIAPVSSASRAEEPEIVEPAVIEEVPARPAVAAVAETPKPSAPLPRARSVKRIDARSENGSVEVRIGGDGQLDYKVFRLDNPSRLVIDLKGVRNAVSRNSIAVDDAVVKRVRVAQFEPTVARVVVDLSKKVPYDIVAVGDEIRVAIGESAVATRTPAPARQEPTETAMVRTQSAPAPARPAPARTAAAPEGPTVVVTESPAEPRRTTAAADIPSQVPTIADNAPSWNVPEPASKGARAVINATQAQEPVRRPTVQEDVFSEAAQQQAPTGQTGQVLSGRTLSGGQRVFTGEPISLTLKEADIRDVLRTFAELTGLNIAVDPGVTGSVTVDFVDVPWDQALDIILRQNGLTFTLEGNVMRIGTIQRIAEETAATRRLTEEERLNVPLTTLSFKLSYARAVEVATLLRDIASPRARIIVDPRTNQLIISEVPEFLRTMQNLITTVDIPTRQVMIEARIVETQSAFAQQWGFNFGFRGDLDPALGTGTGLVFPNRIGFAGGPFNFGVGNPLLSLTLFDVLGTFDLDIALLAAENQGYIKVVSAPRVTTQDNQAAEIQSGLQIPYQTRVNFTTTVTYLDATLRLSVTPQITEAGTVIMDIAVQKNEPATGLNIVGAAGTPLTTRQASTRLMVRDGGTAVIAGIFQTRENDAVSRVPFVHNIPIIGALFRSHDISTSHDELLIFITPRIVRG